MAETNPRPLFVALLAARHELWNPREFGRFQNYRAAITAANHALVDGADLAVAVFGLVAPEREIDWRSDGWVPIGIDDKIRAAAETIWADEDLRRHPVEGQ